MIPDPAVMFGLWCASMVATACVAVGGWWRPAYAETSCIERITQGEAASSRGVEAADLVQYPYDVKATDYVYIDVTTMDALKPGDRLVMDEDRKLVKDE